MITRLGLRGKRRWTVFSPGLPTFASGTMLLLAAGLFFLRGYVMVLYRQIERLTTSTDLDFAGSTMDRISKVLSSIGSSYAEFTDGLVRFFADSTGWYAGIDAKILLSIYIGIILLTLLAFARIVRRVMQD